MKLTDKQERFCQEFLVDLNATQAAIRSGYSEKTANEIGSQNLAKVSIRERVAELQKEIRERNEVTADMLITELKTMAFANAADLYSEGWMHKDVSELTDDQKRAIASVKKIVTTFDGGEKETFEFKLHNKLDAIEKLARHIGLYEKDNTQKQLQAPVLVIKQSDE